jgi:hypothetical protein
MRGTVAFMSGRILEGMARSLEGGGENFIVSCARALMDFSMGSSLLFMSNHGRPVSEDLPINRPQQLLLTSGVQGIVRTLL